MKEFNIVDLSTEEIRGMRAVIVVRSAHGIPCSDFDALQFWRAANDEVKKTLLAMLEMYKAINFAD